MIICLNKYGRILSCGDIVNYIYLPFNEYAGYSMPLILPVTGSLVIGLDRQENYYINAKGNISYDYNGRVNKIGNDVIAYNYSNVIEKIGSSSITYRYSDGKLYSIGGIKIEHAPVAKSGEELIVKIGDLSILYEGISEFASAGCISKIGKADVHYNGGKLQRINWRPNYVHDDCYLSEGCGDILFKRLYQIDESRIVYELKGNNAGKILKIGANDIKYVASGINTGLPSKYKSENISYDSYGRIISII